MVLIVQQICPYNLVHAIFSALLGGGSSKPMLGTVGLVNLVLAALMSVRAKRVKKCKGNVLSYD